MIAFQVERYPSCLKHAFNGTLIARSNDGGNKHYTTIIEDNRNTNDITVDLINIYRNSSEPKSPCNISVKVLTSDGKVVDGYQNIYTNECKEDPRVFIYNNKLYLSYNIVSFKDYELINDSKSINEVENVRIGYVELDKDLKPCNEVTTFPFPTNPWEKNWLFFQHTDGILHIIYTLYPLKIYNDIGNIIKEVEWLHPYDKQKQLLYRTSRYLNKNLNDLRYFRKASQLFYESRFQFDIRGGSSPIFYNDMYFLFAHSREMPGAKYQFIVIVLDRDLNIYGVTNPLDPLLDTGNRIVYPAGAIFDIKTQTWIVSCGLEDEEQILVKLDNEFLMSKLICPEILSNGDVSSRST